MTTLSKEVTLNPGQNQPVSFQVTPQEVGAYSVSVDGLVGSFRATEAPPPTGYLDMTKDELYQYLINKSVARDWWGLSYEQRRLLGLKIIKWWSADWFGSGLCLAKGSPDCSLPPQFDPYKETPAGKSCVYGYIGLGMETCAGFRYCLFTDNGIAPNDLYWWRGVADQWHCYDPGVCFGLPTAVAIGDADWLNCLQLDQDVGSLASWIFFQTWLQDGYPGCDPHHWPILSGAIKIMDITGIDGNRGFVLPKNTIAEIHYQERRWQVKKLL